MCKVESEAMLYEESVEEAELRCLPAWTIRSDVSGMLVRRASMERRVEIVVVEEMVSGNAIADSQRCDSCEWVSWRLTLSCDVLHKDLHCRLGLRG